MNLLYESESFAVMHVLANDTGEAAPLSKPPTLERHGFEIVDKRNGKDLPQLNPRANHHPTVKPTDLMRYLCRLVTPPRGIVLDPFMGSGSTGKAAMLEGFAFVGIEREAEYIDIAKARIQSAVGLL